MDLNLSGKHALVCGGSEGIGRAGAIELASLGADVTLLARREDAPHGGHAQEAEKRRPERRDRARGRGG